MKTLRENFTLEEKSDKQIMESVLCPCPVYLCGWVRSSAIDSPSHRVFNEPNQPSYQELL